MRIAIGALVGCVWLLACGGGGGRAGDAGNGDDAGVVDAAVPLAGTLSIGGSPAMAVIENGKPAEVRLTATLTTADGKQYDVTPETLFAVDPAYGAFTGNVLGLTVAGKIQVSGRYPKSPSATDAQTALTEVTGVVQWVRIDASLSTTVTERFADQEDPALAPQIVYPRTDTVMPRNLGDFEIHWTDTHSNDVFELSLHTPYSRVRVYVPARPGAGGVGAWNAFTPAEWLAAVGQQSGVVYQLRAVNTKAPGKVGAAPPRVLRLTNQAMEGGLYYWATATAATQIGIFRHDMSKPGQPAEEFLTTAKTGDRCIACHVLSRDGTKMAITYQDKRFDGTLLPPGPATTVDVKTRAIADQTQRWNFATFTPDNQQLLSVDHGVLVVRDATTHAELAEMPTTPLPSVTEWVTQPDLSPDGKQLVYVRVKTTNTDFDFKAGQIYKRSYDPVTRVFGPEVAVVNDGQNNFYPSWSPDGAWILFNKNEFGPSYDDTNSSVWVVKADGTGAVELAKANQALGLTNSWARWAPFAQTEGVGNAPLYWITFSSKRDFGVRLTNTGLPPRIKRAQLWMAPFFPDLAAQGQDPSAPAFRLPFQNLESSNHLAQWTQKVVPVIL